MFRVLENLYNLVIVTRNGFLNRQEAQCEAFKLIEKRRRNTMGRENMLAYTRVGKKESEVTLVFIHGSTMLKEAMLPLADKLQEYDCISFDMTAHGESEGEEPEEVAVFAEDVEFSIKQLWKKNEISKKIILLGYSMGGAITCEIAIRKKIETAGIVILSSGGNLKDYTPLVDDLKAMPVEQFRTEDILGGLFGSDTPEADVEKITKQFATLKVDDAIGYGDLMASNRYENLEACREIMVPTLLIHGNDDKIVLPMAAVETWKRIANSELLMIPYKGHAAIYEDIDLVTEKIRSFVKTCSF